MAFHRCCKTLFIIFGMIITCRTKFCNGFYGDGKEMSRKIGDVKHDIQIYVLQSKVLGEDFVS